MASPRREGHHRCWSRSGWAPGGDGRYSGTSTLPSATSSISSDRGFSFNARELISCRRLLGGDLGAAGMPGQHHRSNLLDAQPAGDRAPEFGHGQLVRRLPAATEIGQLEQMGAGPVAERGQTRQKIVGDGHALHPKGLRHPGPRFTDGPAAHPAQHPVVARRSQSGPKVGHEPVGTPASRA
jgi:hypothetical protein